jgi:hypothetical protein
MVARAGIVNPYGQVGTCNCKPSAGSTEIMSKKVLAFGRCGLDAGNFKAQWLILCGNIQQQ